MLSQFTPTNVQNICIVAGRRKCSSHDCTVLYFSEIQVFQEYFEATTSVYESRYHMWMFECTQML